MDDDAARRLLVKLRRFVAEDLDPDERALFAALVAPGVARAYEQPDVEGFGMVSWSPAVLPVALVEALKQGGVRVVGLDPEDEQGGGNGVRS